MAAKRMEMVLTMVFVATILKGAAAQSSCSTVIISLSPCLDYITGNSTTPSSGCCTQFANVVRSQPQCLCQVINSGSSSLGININQTRALAIPSACNVQTPPINRCNATSPTDMPSGTSGSPANPSENGSKTLPSAGGDSSNGSSTKLSFSLVFFVFIASYTSIFTTI